MVEANIILQFCVQVTYLANLSSCLLLSKSNNETKMSAATGNAHRINVSRIKDTMPGATVYARNQSLVIRQTIFKFEQF